jgi:peptide/nickel transport system substrate-binding protein
MTAAPSSYRALFSVLVVAVLIGSAILVSSGTLEAADAPRRGGVLLAVIGADPPSLDPHQESTFANIQLVGPLYSTLLQFDPQQYPKIIGDVATDWKIAPDGKTYTFKIRQGVRFHDG